MIVSSHIDTTSKLGSVVLQSDHADLAWQMALAFGNDSFEALEPRELMEFLVLNHDRGWDETDTRMTRNPMTGLPFSLVSTPLDELLTSGPRSLAFNSQHHPYCGLLASMHVWGLFNGRYGLSDKIVVNFLQGEARLKVDAMLHTILSQREALLVRLEDDVMMRPYIVHEKLMQNYKLLQLFDTLSLYFNDHAGYAGVYPPSSFLNVPRNERQDTSLELQPREPGVFRLTPFPFQGRELTLKHRVFQIPILDIDVDYQKVFAEADSVTETIILVA